MKLAIMQPYIFPYLGYFQLVNAVDKFVVYDNIQFSKKGWVNRNRILVNGKEEYLTFPLKKNSDFLDIDKRNLSDTFPVEKTKMLRRIAEAYRKAPHFDLAFPLLQSIINNDEANLFRFIYQSLRAVCTYLEIKTEFIVSSTIPLDHGLKSQAKVIAICNALNADQYINPIGGVELYSGELFKQNNIELKFIQSKPIVYPQFGNEFVPLLSIIDVMMFNTKAEISKYLTLFNLN